jgi:hypothetical protein
MALAGPSVPQDVVHIILDHLHDDNDTLKNCATVCHSFLYFSRLHLFFSIRLTASSGSERLSSLITCKPELSLLIRELFIIDSAIGWFGVDKSLLTILRMVHRLQLLSIVCWDDLRWEDQLSIEMQSALIYRFRDPTLEAVGLSRISGLPLTVVAEFANLKKLSLHSVNLVDDSSSDSSKVDSLAFPRLRALELMFINNQPISDKIFSRMENVQFLCAYNCNHVGRSFAQQVIVSSARSMKSMWMDDAHVQMMQPIRTPISSIVVAKY